MKIYYIGILKNDIKPAHELCAEKDLSAYGIFTRSSVSEFMAFSAKTIAERTRPGQRQDVESNESTCHAYAHQSGLCSILITEQTYPSLIAHQILSKIMDEFLTLHPLSSFTTTSANASSNTTLDLPNLRGYLLQYQDPENVDSVMRVQRELDETKIVLHKTIESVLERNVKLEDLVAKSEGLSGQSKLFYKQAKKQNSCCVVM
ncbi:Longin-like domain-containing protein [Leptodontidium sp. 2 PMI_412]|nr:Longin-like domain-containing protein [Leptodontidium sp. 2 PMI_412]